MPETQEEQYRRLLDYREPIGAKIKRGLDPLDRDEGIPENKLDTHLGKLKNQT